MYAFGPAQLVIGDIPTDDHWCFRSTHMPLQSLEKSRESASSSPSTSGRQFDDRRFRPQIRYSVHQRKRLFHDREESAMGEFIPVSVEAECDELPDHIVEW